MLTEQITLVFAKICCLAGDSSVAATNWSTVNQLTATSFLKLIYFTSLENVA